MKKEKNINDVDQKTFLKKELYIISYVVICLLIYNLSLYPR